MTDEKTETETVEIIELTPDLAAAFLERNNRNRKLKPHSIEKMAAALRRGEGKLTNDALVINEDGTLDNGQNRCHAVIRSGVPMRVILLWGAAREAQDVMDGGSRRTLADQLTIRGEKNAACLSSALGWLDRYQNDRMRTGGNVLTHPQSLAFLDAHPSLRETARRARRMRNQVPINDGMWAMLIYVFRGIDPDDAEAFVTSMETGLNLDGDMDPRYQLRELILRESRAVTKQPAWLIAALTLKAWNKWRDGEAIKQLSFRAGGASPEDFPVAH